MQPNTAIEVSRGQIWREGNNRTPRYVHVVNVRAVSGKVKIVTCEENGVIIPNRKLLDACIARFNNRFEGYMLVKEEARDLTLPLRALMPSDIAEEEWKKEYASYTVNGAQKVFAGDPSMPLAVIDASGRLQWSLRQRCQA